MKLFFAKNVLAGLLLLLIGAAPCSATDRDNQFWLQSFLTGAFNEDRSFRWYLEYQPRFGNNMSEAERTFHVAMLGHSVPELSKNLFLWFGYAYTPLLMNANYEDVYLAENRFIQQATFEHQIFDQTAVNHRLRFEQRRNDGQPETSHRVRYLFRVSQPVTKISEDVVGIAFFNEVMFNLNSATPGPEAGYDRNRFFIGPYYRTDSMRVDLGYLGEYSVRRDREDRMIHAISVQLALTAW